MRYAQWLLLAALVLHGSGVLRSAHMHAAHLPDSPAQASCSHGHCHSHAHHEDPADDDAPSDEDHHHGGECELCLLLLTHPAVVPSPVITGLTATPPVETLIVVRTEVRARDREHTGAPRAPPIV